MPRRRPGRSEKEPGIADVLPRRLPGSGDATRLPAARARPSASAAALALSAAGAVAVAVAHPTLEILGANAEFFLARSAPRRDAVITALALALALPAAAAAVTWAARRVGAAVGAVVHLALFGGGVALAAHLLVARSTGLAAGAAIGVGAAVGVATTVLYHRNPAFRSTASWLALAPLVSLAVFGVASPTGRMLRAADADPVIASGVVSDVPVVLLMLDEFPVSSIIDRGGDLDPDLVPNLASLASDGVWYRNATTVSGKTEFAAPAILTGRAPRPDTLPFLVDHPDNLMTRLARSHALRVRESFTRLCPSDACARRRAAGPTGLAALGADVAVVAMRVSLPEPWVRDLPAIDTNWNDFRGEDLAAAGRELPRGVAPDEDAPAKELFAGRADDLEGFIRPVADRPGLWVAHVLMPHRPWEFTADGLRYPSGKSAVGLVGGVWREDEDLITQNQARFLMQVRFTDRLVGDALDQLRATGLYDDALVVVVADHGYAFVPGEDRRVPDDENVGAIADVPLIVKYPDGAGPQGVVDDRPASVLDVTPTIYDVLGVEVDDLDGRSLLGPPATSPPPLRLFDGDRWRRFRDWSPDGKRARAAEQVERLGEIDDLSRLWRVGPGAELLGRDVADVATDDAAPGRIRFEAEDALRVARASDGLAPALAIGWIEGAEIDAEGGSFPVALSVGTRVAGVGLADPLDHASAVFSVLVDPDPWPDGFGDADLRVWRIDGGRLVPYAG